jgi:nucleoside-diphosphate-sugar epimerase
MILVTGGAGFIGSHVMPGRRAAGTPARCAKRSPPAA